MMNDKGSVKWILRYVKAEVKAIRSAVKVVAETMKQKFKQQNEWRGTLQDNNDMLATKESVEALTKRVEVLENYKSFIQGRALIAGIIWTVFVLLIGWILNKK